MRKGFSLIEILIVSAVAVSIIFIVGSFNTNINVMNQMVSKQLQSKSDVAQMLQIVTTEVRSAGPSQSGAYTIDVAATGSFAFYSSINKNGVMERVRYFFASSTIYKGVIEPTGTPAAYPSSSEIVTDIVDSAVVPTSTPLFKYYDGTYTGTQTSSLAYPITVSNIRLVLMSFGANIKPQEAPGPTFFSTLMDVRNLRSN